MIDGKVQLRFPLFQLRRWTVMKRSFQAALVLYIYLYLTKYVTKQVLLHIAHLIIKESYKAKEVLIEAESLCNLSTHHLLGLLIHLKNNISINDKPKEAKPLISDVERLMLHINVKELVENMEEWNRCESEEDKVVCEAGVSVLKACELFEYYAKSEQLSNVRTMFEVLGIVKKIFIEEKYEEPKFKVHVDKVRRQSKVSHKVINYELDLPLKEVRTQTINIHTLKKPTTSPIPHSPAAKKLLISKSDFALTQKSAAIFCKDSAVSPLFILSSQKKLDTVNGRKERWSAIGASECYVSYKL
eukprot:TRINITY_DN12880_c0_g2_i3.p1 TRINITY_DN12880_c0_g2~~TRINITY_DN12880_c0_g2_i3.p1  ORF type:complete len:301 (+),score=62.99 TRINITY_DN12880_c0_g2_i3:190-1092(+)